MGTIAISAIDIGAMLIGGIGASLLPKIFGGQTKAASMTASMTAEEVAVLKKLKANAQAVIDILTANGV